MNFLDKNFVWFVVKFLSLFGLFYFGTLLVIGLASPGGSYSKFVDEYFDYVTWISKSLVNGTRGLLQIFGIDTYTAPRFVIRIVGGTGVRIAYDCVGYGVMSFWLAFVVAASNHWKRKIIWVLVGWIVLWFINIIRIALLLVAYNKHWKMPLGIDHHTWFNIVAYGAIFTMMYLFERNTGTKTKKDAY